VHLAQSSFALATDCMVLPSIRSGEAPKVVTEATIILVATEHLTSMLYKGPERQRGRIRHVETSP
jgi:hypothetical protein